MSVNAPESGTIKELLVNEEDTVTVGQDLIKLEPGEAPEGGKQESAPKQESASEQPKESAPAAEKPKESTPAPEKPKETPQASKPAPPPKEAPKAESKTTEAKPAVGGREERRVRTRFFFMVPGARLTVYANIICATTGQDEPHASAHRRAPEAVPEHRRFPHHLQ